MPILKIDGKEIEVQKGTNLIIAALKAEFIYLTTAIILFYQL